MFFYTRFHTHVFFLHPASFSLRKSNIFFEQRCDGVRVVSDRTNKTIMKKTWLQLNKPALEFTFRDEELGKKWETSRLAEEEDPDTN